MDTFPRTARVPVHRGSTTRVGRHACTTRRRRSSSQADWERRDSNPRLSPHRDSRVNAELGRSCADSASCHIRARRQRAYDGTHVDSRTDDVCQRLASALPTLAKGGKSLYCLTATYPRGGKGALTYSTRYRTTPRRNSSDSPRWMVSAEIPYQPAACSRGNTKWSRI